MFSGGSSTRRRVDPDRRERKSTRTPEDKEREKEKEKKKQRRPASARKVSSSSTKDRDRERDRSPRVERDQRPDSSNSARMMPSIVPEMERRPSVVSSTRNSSYPTFSKAHSKEAVGSREDVINPRLSLYTPDPTDLGSESRGKDSPDYLHTNTTHGAGPPSPPLTTTEPDLRRTRSEKGMRHSPSHIRIVSPPRKHARKGSAGSTRERASPRPSGSTSTLRKRQDIGDVESEASSQAQSAGSDPKKETMAARRDTDVDSSMASARPPGAQSTVKSQTESTMTGSTVDSSATSVPAARKTASRIPLASPLDVQSSPVSVPDSSPRTPTPLEPNFPPAQVAGKHTPAAVFVDAEASSGFPSPYSVASTGFGGAPPPPPPPPPNHLPGEIPRVDYLLQNGGLPQVIPRRFLSVVSPVTPVSAQYSSFNSPRSFGPQQTDIRALFAPFQNVLDDYLQVMSKNGSLAVATGYRSVARRLLDRLEQVFNRNISSETCDCIMCQNASPSVVSADEDTGLSWGEILEYVSGRRELSSWPPFTISQNAPNLASVAEAPMQKLDMDIPPEYRDHYIRQSKKTKDVVQAWLRSQPELPSSPPQEVDDETLIFAMVTHLEPENIKLFTALLRGMSTLPESRAPTPAATPVKSELMKRTALALQRLYRLPNPPRDPECSIYLLKNPQLHGVLATLAAVSSGEWDILISGRFDGFLWSGAESNGGSALPARGPTPAMTPGFPPSRGATPFSTGGPSRGPTPAPNGTAIGAPVQMDEDTEIAVLAEVEREIYAGMDALEDAFEALHAKAEQVREALRLRNAGLSMSASARRGSSADGPEARIGTPSNFGHGIWDAMGKEDEDWIDDGKSEIRPDDSASNISYNRRRRRHREKERRTPAPVEEEDESVLTEEDYRPRRR
jgi:hypothetical protein